MAETKYSKELAAAKIMLEDIEEALESEEKEDIEHGYERINEIIKKLESSKDHTTELMLSEEKTIEEVREWNRKQKEEIKEFRDLRKKLKQELEKFVEKEKEQKQAVELEHQQNIRTQQERIDREREQKIEEARIRDQQREEEWYRKKLEMELEITKKKTEEIQVKQQSVKLQKYTITPFKGEYKDWLRFWNQFMVEVDGSSISEISKFNYLLELVTGKPKEDILGLPHSEDGYLEAKRILEKTYGKDIKIHKALIKELEGLDTISSVHRVKEIHDYYNKLSRIVRTLVTMKKLDTAQSFVYSLMDKLGPVKEALIQKDDDWENWNLEELVENLEKYIDRHPLPVHEVTTASSTSTPYRKRGNEYQADWRQRDKMMFANAMDKPQGMQNSCVYCDFSNHRSSDCRKVINIAQRREVLKKKRLCFNCTGFGHGASKCRSRGCRKCNGRHHTSLCDATMGGNGEPKHEQPEMGKRAIHPSTTLHATLMAKVKGIPVRIMVDSGASSSYICTSLLTKLRLKPVSLETRNIEQMYGTIQRRVQVFKVTVQSNAVDGFRFDLKCINGEKDMLTYLPNPRIKTLKKKYKRFRCLKFSDEDTEEDKLPIHIILGAADYQRIKTTEPPVLGPNPDVDPGAEFTMLGWTLTGKTVEVDTEAEKLFMTLSPKTEFEQMCSIEVLGLADIDGRLDKEFHEHFQEKLVRLDDGTYSTRLPWKPEIVKVPMNKELAIGRLYSTTRRLEKLKKLEEYHDIMEAQVKDGILEIVPEKPTGEVLHYVPHQAVIREDAESTRMRIVYDLSARASPDVPSLNDCLEKGPSLQPLILDILLRNRMSTNCITGDIKKAFLQIKLDPADRDVQRLFWYNNLEDRKITEYRFTRVIFGSAASPYILGATLKKHISQYREAFPETVETLLRNTYVDDVQCGGQSKEDLANFKREATHILQQAGFSLHKWHSNIDEVESPDVNTSIPVPEDTTTYAKEEMGTKANETKILGIPWNKRRDELSINFSKCLERQNDEVLTKRKMLSAINGIFDPLGLASPVVITAKFLYSQLCQLKLSWDEEIQGEIANAWKKWIKTLVEVQSLSVPRSIIASGVVKMVLHGFADASKMAIGVCIYLVAHYENGEASQQLLIAKSRIAPEKSIPRLELVAAHTMTKLMTSIKIALEQYQIDEIHGWVDSTTVLQWMKGKGTWSLFVRNRIKAINNSDIKNWHYVPTGENPSDVGSRGSDPRKLDAFWFSGPQWLARIEEWPDQPEISDNAETATEMMPMKERAMLAKEEKDGENDSLDSLLERRTLWKTLRITAYMMRFAKNCQRKEKRSGLLTTKEIEAAEKMWIKKVQQSEPLKCDIDLQQDSAGIWRCTGRVPDYHPIFLPRSHRYVTLLIQQYHGRLLHGGVSITLCNIRERFWISKARALVKKVVHECSHCKKFRVKPLPAPAKSLLPEFRSQFSEPFAYTGVDFAGPITYRESKKTTAKAYVALFTCSATRAVHLKLCKDLTADEFKRTMKEFVARRGTPRMIVSDNGKTFIATSKWLKKLKKKEELMNYLAMQRIVWRFNLSRAPWWGGFFERLIGIMKRSLSKVVGRSLLRFHELEEVLLDVECSMNNRPLCYQGEEFQQPVITPNILIRGQPANMLEENLELADNEEGIPKRIRFLAASKEQLRKRWMKEYVHALDERSRKQTKNKLEIPKMGKVVLLKDDIKNRALWRLGRVVGTVMGRDGDIRGLKIKLGNGYIVERPLQLLCDLEIGGENADVQTSLNPEAVAFTPRRRSIRKAREDAMNQIAALNIYEDQEE